MRLALEGVDGFGLRQIDLHALGEHVIPISR